MGWKAECIFVNENGLGYFGTLPPHRPQRAVALLAQLYPGVEVHRVCGSTLVDEFVPPKSHFAFGAYDAGCVLSDWDDEVIGCAADRSRPILQRFLSLFPKASLLVLELGSVTNFFGYALYEGGSLRRAYGGNARDGITINFGEPLPEEASFFRDSEVRDGRRFFRSRVYDVPTEYSAAAFGETLAFHVSGRFLGLPLNSFPSESLRVERFRRPRFDKSVFSKVLSRFLKHC